MTSRIERRIALVKKVEELIKKGWDSQDIINELGKEGVARRTALEYINSVK